MCLAACDRVRLGGLLIYKDTASAPAWAAWVNRLHDLVLARQWIHYAPIADVEAIAGRAARRAQRWGTARLVRARAPGVPSRIAAEFRLAYA